MGEWGGGRHRDGHIKLTDFGLARDVNDLNKVALPQHTHTHTHSPTHSLSLSHTCPPQSGTPQRAVGRHREQWDATESSGTPSRAGERHREQWDASSATCRRRKCGADGNAEPQPTSRTHNPSLFHSPSFSHGDAEPQPTSRTHSLDTLRRLVLTHTNLTHTNFTHTHTGTQAHRRVGAQRRKHTSPTPSHDTHSKHTQNYTRLPSDIHRRTGDTHRHTQHTGRGGVAVLHGTGGSASQP